MHYASLSFDFRTLLKMKHLNGCSRVAPMLRDGDEAVTWAREVDLALTFDTS